MDYVGLAALIVAVFGALGHLIEHSHIKKFKLACLESDCRKTPHPTPAHSTSSLSPDITATGC
jgi:hypothetical protein